MRVLLIGKGGREHALAWKIRGSALLQELFVWPGGPVFSGLATPLPAPASASFHELVAVAKAHGIGVVISGPEAPLSEGLADTFNAAGIPTFGPVQAAAQLESSKAFAKDMMQRAGIPTAAYEVVGDEAACREVSLAFLAKSGGAVLKASGLAAGKGVFVCFNAAEIEEGLRHLYHTDMRAAAAAVVVEEVLLGRECSYFSLIGAGGPTGLGFAVDFKRLHEQDQGPNTGGMGCYAPVPWLPADAEQQVVDQVVAPLLRALQAAGLTYCGCLYVGLMWSETKGPQVVEFNVRLGDPEAQVLAAYDDRDWLAVMAAKAGVAVPAAALAAATAPVSHQDRSVAVVMVSQGYPFGGEQGPAAELPLAAFTKITEEKEDVKVFAAAILPGAAGHVRTGVGRVLTVAARGASFAAARAKAYARVQELAAAWPGARWRRDIAQRVAQEVD